MSAEPNQDRIDDLFARAVSLPAAERDAFLKSACDDNAEVLAEVRKLLVAHVRAEQATEFLAEPPDNLRLFPDNDGRKHPLIGQRIGPYEVKRLLGSGGFGQVYFAFRSDDYKQKVAIKVLRSDIDVDERTLARFELERQLLADLHHDHIARLLYGGTLDTGRPYIVMEYVKGLPITEYCDTKRLSITDRLAIFRQVCEAVAYAHRYSTIHRDIKPGNILVTDDGTVKLLDFGIAKMVDPISQRRMVTISEGGMPLTPEYASPEQVRGEGISTASDVYSLGVVLYELLTGRRPYEFRRYSPAEFERVICEEEPRKPSAIVLEPVRNRRDDGTDDIRDADTLAQSRSVDSQKLNRQLRGDLEQIVLMVLRKEPHRRYENVDSLIQDLEHYSAGEPIVARPVGRLERYRRWCNRNRVVAGLAAAFLIVLIGGAVMSTALALKYRNQLALADENLRLAQMAVGGEAIKALEAEIGVRTKAATASPDNLGELFSLGMVHLRLADALEEEAWRSAGGRFNETTASYLRERETLLNAGDDRSHSDRSEGSTPTHHYLKSIEVMTQLVTASPSTPDYRNGLAYCQGSYGNALSRHHDMENARRQYEQAIADLRTLVVDHPDWSSSRLQWASYETGLSYVLSKLDEPARALQHSYNALACWSEIEFENTFENEQITRGLEDSRADLTRLLKTSGDLKLAKSYCSRDTDQWKKWIAQSPDKEFLRYELGRSHACFGELLFKLDDFDGALEQAEIELKVWAKLRADFPGDEGFYVQNDAAYGRLNNALLAIHDLERVNRCYAQLFANWIQRDIESVNLTCQLELARAHNFLGETLRNLKNWTAARNTFEEALAIGTNLVNKSPKIDKYRGSLGWSLSSLGDLEREHGNAAKAAQYYDQFIAIGSEMLIQNREQFGFQHPYTIGCVHWITSVYERANKPMEAVKLSLEYGMYDDAQHLALSANDDVFRVVMESARTTDKLTRSVDAIVFGELRLVAGDPATAESAIRSAMAADKNSKNFMFKSLGWCLLAQGKAAEAREAFQQALRSHRQPNGTYKLEKVDSGELTSAFFLDLVSEQEFADRLKADKASAGLPWFYIGQRREITGNKSSAITAYERCIELSEKHQVLCAYSRWRLRLLRSAEQPSTRSSNQAK